MRKFLLTALILCGVVSVRARSFQYVVNFRGPDEFPPNASPGTGTGTVIYDNTAHTLQLQASFSGLTGTTTASHIHAPTTAPRFQNAGVATTTPSFSGFPLGVTSGSFSNTLDLTLTSSYNPSFVTANGGTTAAAEAALAESMLAGKAYWNIHSSTFPGGEIRGFLTLVLPSIRIVNLKVGTNLTVTSTIEFTNGVTMTPEFNTNLLTTNWSALTVQSNKFANGTNEMICGKPAANPVFLRIRGQGN
ncbi:MAG: CHRD domain-containing protein [Verrucomicrobiota bacterium]